MYEWPELIKLWEQEKVTQEQAIGQLLTHGEAQAAQIVALQRRLEAVEHALSIRSSTPPTAPPPAPKGKPPRR